MPANFVKDDETELHVKNGEGRKAIPLLERQKIVNRIFTEVEGITDESLTLTELKKLKPLTSVEITVWPKTKEHKCEGKLETEGLTVTLEHKAVLELKQGAAVEPTAGAPTDAPVMFERSEETLTKENCKLVFSRTIPTAKGKDVVIKYVCTRDKIYDDNYVVVEFPTDDGFGKPQELRMYTSGTHMGQIVGIRGTVSELIVAANASLPLEISEELIIRTQNDGERFLEATNKIRKMVFNLKEEKPAEVPPEDDIPF